MIRGYGTTDASVHDSKVSDSLIDDKDSKGEDVWLDAGYVGKGGDLKDKGVNPIICETRISAMMLLVPALRADKPINRTYL